MRRLLLPIILSTFMVLPALSAPDPLAFVKKLYDTSNDDSPASNWMNFTSKRLSGLIKTAQKKDEMWLDADPVVDGQDVKLSGLKLEKLSEDRCKAAVRAIFKNFDQPRRVRYELVLENGAWRIADIVHEHSGEARVTTLAAGKKMPSENPVCANN